MWGVEARNNLKDYIRSRGEPIVGILAKLLRGERDKPTFADLAKRKTVDQILKGLRKPNPGADRMARGFKIGGTVFLLVDLGLTANRVYQAPQQQRPRTAIVEGSRMIFGVVGGIAGGICGAGLGTVVGSMFPVIAPVSITAGSILGGLAGAYLGGRAGEEFGNWLSDQLGL